MHSKKVLLLFSFFVFFSFFVYAKEFDIQKHLITIEIDEEGKARVVEKFELTFPNNFLQKKFEKNWTKFGLDIERWTALNPNFRLHIGGIKEVVPGQGNILFTPIEDRAGVFVFEYVLKEKAVSITKDESRFTDYKLNNFLLNEFVTTGSTYSIPKNTFLQVVLPPKVVDITTDSAAKIIRGKKVMVQWENVKLNNLKLEYRVFKQIAPFLSIASWLKKIVDSEDNGLKLFIVGFFLFLFGVVYWQKKRIEKYLSGIAEHYSLQDEEK